MKKNLLSLLFALVTFQGISQSIPEAPIKVEFANVNILLNSDSRQKINSEVQRLLTPQNSFLDQKLERMQLYFPIIERILEVENVPEDFKYLAVLESSLNSDAVSVTNAVGFWQFKDFTAEEMGLTMNRQQDDRKNLQLSTQAAAQYLKKNNQVFKNWVSTALSFHVGAGGAAEFIPVDWSFANEIKFDNNPHPYLLKSVAHKIAYEHRLRNINGSSRTVVEYPAKGKSLSEIAKEARLPESEIKKYNTWLNGSSVPSDKDYVVLIHTDKTNAELISSNAKDLAKTSFTATGYPKLKRQTMVVTSTDQPVFYEINDKKGILAQPGDEVAQLSRKGKVSISKFLAYNDMTDRDFTKEGTVYYLQKKYRKAEVPYHTLGSNQSLWDAAHQYGIRLKNLKKYNRIKDNESIQPGRVLWMQKKRPKKQAIKYNKEGLVAPPEVFTTDPKGSEIETAVFQPQTPKTSNSDEPKVHRVLENETLFSLANKYGTTVEEIRRLNNLGPNEGIKYNQRLIIPQSNDEPEDNWVEEKKEEPIVMPDKKPVVFTPEPTRPTKKTEYTETASRSSHKVQPGETLFSISKRYGTTVDELRAANRMSSSETLKSGQNLVIPGSFGSVTSDDLPKASPSKVTTTHTVSKGETLFSIANKYGVNVEDIRALNNVSGNNIMVGQKLKVSGAPQQSSVSVGTQYHTVKRGETLFSISKKYGVTVNELRKWNNITGNLQSGKRIIVRK